MGYVIFADSFISLTFFMILGVIRYCVLFEIVGLTLILNSCDTIEFTLSIDFAVG